MNYLLTVGNELDDGVHATEGPAIYPSVAAYLKRMTYKVFLVKTGLVSNYLLMNKGEVSRSFFHELRIVSVTTNDVENC